MSWVLDHLDDLESDFSVFHRIEDIDSMHGPRFFALAFRVAAYDGVMRARVAEAQERQKRRHGGDGQVEHRTLGDLQRTKQGNALFDRETVRA